MGATAKGPILIVEDDASIRELLRDALEQEGLDVVTASDGEQAIVCAGRQRPAAIVLDMGLPLLDGASVADRIRDQYGDLVPFIVVTASRRIEEAASRIRAARYLTKPFDITDLVAAVRDAVEPPPDTAREHAPSPVV
ncbi:MAG: response regulator transcription factor [Chloroflexota bacterium]|nr:response regulator transcription factor [Chloroflexota bacterium]